MESKSLKPSDGDDLPVSPTERQTIQSLDSLSTELDSKYKIPFTGKKFGYDAIIGLIPGIGDAATSLVSGYILIQAYRLGLPKATLTRMAVNILFDFLIGSAPLISTVGDILWKANEKNMTLLRKRIKSPESTTQDVTFLLRYVLPTIVGAILIGGAGFALLLYVVWDSITSSEILRGIFFTIEFISNT